jgi:hypothetical protein
VWPGIVPDDITCTDNVVNGRHIIQYSFEGRQIRVDVGNQAYAHTEYSKSLAEMLAIILLIMLRVNACRLSNYCFVWIDGISTIRDLFECCFQADLTIECERRRGYRRTPRCTN